MIVVVYLSSIDFFRTSPVGVTGCDLVRYDELLLCTDIWLSPLERLWLTRALFRPSDFVFLWAMLNVYIMRGGAAVCLPFILFSMFLLLIY